MISLDELNQLHENLKNNIFFRSQYNILRQEGREHWERVVFCIEKMIESYYLEDIVALKKAFNNFLKELSLVKQVNIGIEVYATSSYYLEFQKWYRILLNKTLPEKGYFENTHYFMPLIDILAAQYQQYEKKKVGFVDDLQRQRERKKKREADIFALKIAPKQNEFSSLLNVSSYVLANILRFLDKKSDLLSLELTSYFLRDTVQKLNLWHNVIITHNQLVALKQKYAQDLFVDLLSSTFSRTPVKSSTTEEDIKDFNFVQYMNEAGKPENQPIEAHKQGKSRESYRLHFLGESSRVIPDEKLLDESLEEIEKSYSLDSLLR
ncbi:Uncharacterised protein [Legionella beliardensis]|uniref:F-box domain-containing protein n=1 Tax=Legionella beliardensis TaxID=91822 RepID=A0A378JT77_9GAMM|nr:hypothetical protein [Legionella beliardensis]STX55779.1 Uncharacterised protein [Legionella beliardensis]